MSSKSNGKDKEKKPTGSKIPFLTRKKTPNQTQIIPSGKDSINNNIESKEKDNNPTTEISNKNPVEALGGVLKDMKLTQDPKKDKKAPNKPAPKSTKEEKEKIATFDKVVLKANGFTYVADKVIGNGSFGVVVRAVVQETNDVVAIKKVLQDKRYKNRELQIMQMLSHSNIVQLKNSFYTNGDKAEEVYLNLILEFVPDTVYRVTRHYAKLKQTMPIIYCKLYIYQLLKSLAYIHSLGICHRDIKPQNLLLDPQTGVLKLCDFGSAKMLVKGEPNVSYICSRYYRAPELIFGSENYSTSIDIWSAGCVMAELLLGQPLFPGESGVDQLVEIIKILGTPTRGEIQSMNQTYTEYKFPQIKGHPWSKVFRHRTPPEAIELIDKLLQYTPSTRLKPLEACAHPFFDELREPNTALPNGKPLPSGLFDFSESELKDFKHLLPKLIPKHMQKEQQ